jgi:YD repeat-containing protein
MARPEHAIADADMVFGLGRSILEAMAGRRAAYVYGVAGIDGGVSPDNYAALEADGFAGQVSGDVPSLERLTADLRSWSPEMGVDNRALALRHGTTDHEAELLALLRDLGAPTRRPLSHHQELTRLVRLEWDAQSRLRAVVEENRTLRARVEDLSREATDARTALAAREEATAEITHKLDALRATRRFRLASRLAAPLDRARAALVRARAKRQAGSRGVDSRR